ncbi:MAG: chemotaxis-specific protein-glutamate methyltransferase CheB [Lachnospiraceae bacterium]|nr:chemotaxis-specific protein-glutamate methyltransferase CheB [Lachnospiraceae bacterium]
MYKVLVVDDSALMRKIMCDIINSIQGFQVVDICSDGQSAYRRISEFGNFDVITMNVALARMSGLEVMERLNDDGCDIPIVAVSSQVKEDRDMTVKALESGAVEVLVRPYRVSPADRETIRADLVSILEAAVSKKKQPAARTTVTPSRPSEPVRPRIRETEPARRQPDKAETVKGGVDPRELSKPLSKVTIPLKDIKKLSPSVVGGYDLVAIASSTGGPQALRTCLPMLPKHLGVPVVIVQHMPKGFTASLAERIDDVSNVRIKEAEEGEILQNDTVYIAPGGWHLEVVSKSGGKLANHLSDAPAIGNLRPCADVMFHSIAKLPCKRVLCVVLTGMGSDGTEGISYLGAYKEIYCITQSADTCVVYGMPKAADQAGLSCESVPITQIANAIAKRLGV